MTFEMKMDNLRKIKEILDSGEETSKNELPHYGEEQPVLTCVSPLENYASALKQAFNDDSFYLSRVYKLCLKIYRAEIAEELDPELFIEIEDELQNRIEKTEKHFIKYQESSPPAGMEDVWELLLNGFSCYLEGLLWIAEIYESEEEILPGSLDPCLEVIYKGDVLVKKAEKLIKEYSNRAITLAVA